MTLSATRSLVYPDSDGQPMADNSLQFRWIVLIKENLECLFADDPDVFVAGDLLWYPVEGHPEIRVAPDVMVVLGRPKGERGSYRQWQEGNVTPQVVFEILSPGNRLTEMAKKLEFYRHHGVTEYYLYDPDHGDMTGYQRANGNLAVIDGIEDWVSPLLGIRFLLTPTGLEIHTPQGERFLTTVELSKRAEQERQRADLAEQENARLRERLRQAGLET